MSESDPRPHHRLTLAAIAVVAYALSNLVHEGVGHGLTCVAVGGGLESVSATHASCLAEEQRTTGGQLVTAGGTLANLVAGALAWLVVRRAAGPPAWRYFAWLFMTVNFLQGAGYWLFSGVGNIGDWAHLVAGREPHWLYRVVLATLGLAAYCAAIVLGLRTLNPLLGHGPDRLSRGRWMTLLAYLVGGVLYMAAGALNPVSPMLVLVSAGAAAFGGTSALAWMSAMFDTSYFPAVPGAPLSVERSAGWIAAGVVAAMLFVAVLGPGLSF